jgi:hypothetical protein
MTLFIVPVVEGQTEQGCVERLLHRVWQELLRRPERLQVVEPFRGRRDQLVHPNGVALTDTVRKAFLKLKARAKKDADAHPLVLILLDAEGDCPATLGPRLLEVGRKALPAGTSVCCVLAKRMIENWIAAGASTLAGVNGMPDPLQPPDDPESCHGAGWLDAQLRKRNRSRKYKKTVDAEVFVRAMNLGESEKSSSSFRNLCQKLNARLPGPPDATEKDEDLSPPAPPSPGDVETPPGPTSRSPPAPRP